MTRVYLKENTIFSFQFSVKYVSFHLSYRFFTVRKIGMDDNYHQSVFDESMELIQTPLIAPSSTHYLHHHKVVSYPYNITAFQGGNSPKDTVITNYTDKKSTFHF